MAERIVMRRFLVLAAFALALAAAGASAKPLTPRQAAGAAGQRATVCGIAASIHFAARSRGQPTFINLGAPYPDQVFTIVIWGDDRPNFKPPPESWQGKRLCVTGRIKLYRGTPEVIAYGPDQIQPGK